MSYIKRSNTLILLSTLFVAGLQQALWSKTIDLTSLANDTIALANPHKGWYHHFPDNHINKYIIQDDRDLLNIPGMDHLYLRLSWAYLEPQEGQYNWAAIDDIITKWTAHGLKIAFRISCKETSTDRIEQQFATPKWVMEAGARGGYYRKGETVGPDGPWEPIFDDPIFLRKLENFLCAFAERYDGKPWLRYIDVGSIGDRGEGHTWSGSRKEYGYTVRKKHVDLYHRHFKKSQVVVTDDFVYAIADAKDRQQLHQDILHAGISYRDDSILVDYYIGAFPKTYTVRSPAFFEDVYRHRPTVLELEHYSGVTRLGNWLGRPGSSMAKAGQGKTGSDFFLGALDLLHASYIGYHGDARQWYTDNPELTTTLLNRCAYWYFLNRVTFPASVTPGSDANLIMAWENRGVAPAYQPYRLVTRLQGPTSLDISLDAGNRAWLPRPSGPVYVQTYPITMPATLTPGTYQFKLKLYCEQTNRNVHLALDPGIQDKQGFYTIGDMLITRLGTIMDRRGEPGRT